MSLPIVSQTKKSPLQSVAHTIAVASGKGGVGKSTVTVNLALALKEKGKKVGILDADLYGPSVRKMIPADHFPKTVSGRIEPALGLGIKTVSMAYFREEGKASAVRAPIANGVIKQFIEMVNWGELDYLLIDFPPGTGDIQLTLAQNARLDGAIIVTTPQEMALIDVRKSINLFQSVHVPLIGILENMSFYQDKEGQKIRFFGSGGGQKLSDEYGVPLLGQLPIDPEICAYADQGLSLFHRPDGLESLVARDFLSVATQTELRLLGLFESVAKRSWLIDSQTIGIEWSKGGGARLNASFLQAICPCAGCVESRPEIKKDVTFSRIEPVGRYALRFLFSSGCSQGIYEFSFLRNCSVNPKGVPCNEQ